MTNRKGKSPKEILSLFDDISNRKEKNNLPDGDDMSIFDVIAAQGKSTNKAKHNTPQSDAADCQAPPEQQPNPLKQDYSLPAWKKAEADLPGKLRASWPAKKAEAENSRQKTNEQKQVESYKQAGAGGKTKKIISICVLLLLAVSIFVFVRFVLGPKTKGIETDKFTVQAILFDKENPSAVLSGRVVREGDIISGVTVEKINKNSVVFQKNETGADGARRFTRELEP